MVASVIRLGNATLAAIQGVKPRVFLEDIVTNPTKECLFRRLQGYR